MPMMLAVRSLVLVPVIPAVALVTVFTVCDANEATPPVPEEAATDGAVIDL